MIVYPKKYPNMDMVVIDDFYEKNELEEIKDEIKELYTYRSSALTTGSAKDDDNIIKKTGTGIWVNDIYKNNELNSSILKYTRKIFNKELLSGLEDKCVTYRHIRQSTLDYTLLNYYDDGEEYKEHLDRSLYTVLIMIKLGSIKGGDIYFKDVNDTIKFKENRAVIFPGCAFHQALPTKCSPGSYRVTIANFINYNDANNR